MDAMMDAIIYQRARRAAGAAINLLGISVSAADFADITQSAAIGYWRGWTRNVQFDSADHRRAYAFVAARNAAIRCIDRQLCGNNPLSMLPLMDEVIEDMEQKQSRELPLEIAVQLFYIFYRSRTKRGVRGMLAAARDTFIISAAWSGDSLQAIADALDVHIETARTYQKRARRVLRQYIAEEEENEYKVSVK